MSNNVMLFQVLFRAACPRLATRILQTTVFICLRSKRIPVVFTIEVIRLLVYLQRVYSYNACMNQLIRVIPRSACRAYVYLILKTT